METIGLIGFVLLGTIMGYLVAFMIVLKLSDDRAKDAVKKFKWIGHIVYAVSSFLFGLTIVLLRNEGDALFPDLVKYHEIMAVGLGLVGHYALMAVFKTLKWVISLLNKAVKKYFSNKFGGENND